MLGIRASHLLPIQYLHDIYLFYPPSIPREAAGIICYTYILALYYLNTYSIIFHLNWHLLWDPGRLVPTMATSWQKEEARKSDGEGGRGGSWGVAPLLKSRDPTWQVGKNRHLSKSTPPTPKELPFAGLILQERICLISALPLFREGSYPLVIIKQGKIIY